MKKKFLSLLVALAISVSFVSCTSSGNSTSTSETESKIKVAMKSIEDEKLGDIDTVIELGEDIKIDGEGAEVKDNIVNITAAGTYKVTGTLSDGQIVVNVDDSEKVYLLLDDANITSSNNSPIYVKNAKKTIIALADDSKNYIEDGKEYALDADSDEPNAAIFSKDDLTFIGEGYLEVKGNYKNGIVSKDDLRIQSGNIKVTAVNDGIKGKDSVTVKNADVTVDAQGDGIKSNNDKDESKGYIWIEDGSFVINSGEDGIQAETDLLISSGSFKITTAGGSANAESKKSQGGDFKDFKKDGNFQKPDMNGGEPPQMPDGQNPPEGFTPPEGGETPPEMPNGDMKPGDGQEPPTDFKDTPEKPQNGEMPKDSDEQSTDGTEETTSTKAIKANGNITFEGGTIEIDSKDDAIHSNDSVVVNSGEFNIATGDDGIHADSTLDINDGNINISKSYEGLESEVITINGGNIKVVASDDGINAASSSSSTDSSTNEQSKSNAKLNINGGYVVVDAIGDGLDANGSIYMKDGVVIVNGPTSNGDGALDYDDEFVLTGGTLIAAGSIGMAQAPSDSSEQKVLSIGLSNQQENSLIRVETEDGEEVVTFMPSKKYQSVIISSPKLEDGKTYNIYTGGTSTGESKDGLYSGGEYSGGTKVDSATISGTVTQVGKSGMMNGQGGAMGMPGGGKGRRNQQDSNQDNSNNL